LARHVGFHPDAIIEAKAAARWYRERSDTASDAFLAEIARAVDSISLAPRRWPLHAGGTRRFLLRRFPFVVVYREDATGIEVVAVAHGRRRPNYWTGR
jgi:plasmid stabilization system protein ParE